MLDSHAHVHTSHTLQQCFEKLELQQQRKTDKQGSGPRQLAGRMEQIAYNTCTHKTDQQGRRPRHIAIHFHEDMTTVNCTVSELCHYLQKLLHRRARSTCCLIKCFSILKNTELSPINNFSYQRNVNLNTSACNVDIHSSHLHAQ